jgi:hypothetical protein
MHNRKSAIRNLRFAACLTLLVGGLLLPAAPALADASPPVDDGVVIWNEDYALEEGEWLNGDLVVFNGDATLEADSRVEGSVIIWNGSADVEGVIENDLVVSSGDIYLGNESWVQGNVICSWNCDIERDEGARVDGSFTEGVPPGSFRIENDGRFPVPVPSLPTLWMNGPRQAMRWVLNTIRLLVSILVVAATAGIVALIWPHQTALVGRTAIETPGPSLGIGLLTAVAGTVLIVALAITICLSPVAILAALALGTASLFGWIGVGALVGKRLLRAFNVRHIAPLWAAATGTLITTLISLGLSGAFCLAPLGWLLIFVLGCLGLGAVVLTRLGTTPYAPSRPTPPPIPTPVETPAPPEPAADEEEEEEDIRAEGESIDFPEPMEEKDEEEDIGETPEEIDESET